MITNQLLVTKKYFFVMLMPYTQVSNNFIVILTRKQRKMAEFQREQIYYIFSVMIMHSIIKCQLFYGYFQLETKEMQKWEMHNAIFFTVY